METIQDAKDYLRHNFKKGVTCPCCGRRVQLYRRKLNSGMAGTLIKMWREHAHGWVNVKDWLRENSYRNNHDWTMLRHWELIEERDIPPEHGGKTQGEWRVTPKGRMFALNMTTVPSHLLEYNQKSYGTEGDQVTVVDCLGKKFNYMELLKDSP